MTRIIKWLWAVLLVAALAAPSAVWAGSIGFQAASAEDPMVNAFCTGSGAPDACCTGVGTGTCGPGLNSLCTGLAAPYYCCTGAGTGNCNWASLGSNLSFTAPRTLYQSNTNRAILADFDAPVATNTLCTGSGAPWACCTGAGAGTCTTYCTGANTPYSCCTGSGTGNCGASRCILLHFPMPPDYVAAGNMTWTYGMVTKGNATCTAAGVPWPCCTGSGTGTCGVLDGTHAACFHTDVACAAGGGAYGFGAATLLYAAPTAGASNNCQAPSATGGIVSRQTSFSTTSMTMSGCHPKDSVIVRFCRDANLASASSENTSNMSLIDLVFTY